ncbi:MAG: hypothetical protein Kow00105_07690 [Phycisphaeraceae bacterium]
MAIEFHCDCGRLIRVADKFAGMRAKCPGCGAHLTIPDPEPADDQIDSDLLYEAIGNSADEPGTAQCPNCDHPISVNAAVCSHCGYNRIARTHSQLADLGEESGRRDPMAPILTIAGIDITWLRLILILVPLIGFPVWYYNGPGADLHIKSLTTANVIFTIDSGKARVPFNPGGNAIVNMARAQNKGKLPLPLSAADQAEYTLGGGDSLVVCEPDDDGDHVLMEVSLRQLTIRDAGKTALYNTIIRGEDFEIVPPDGSPPVPGRFLYYRFEGDRAEIDLARAETSSYKALYPTTPTRTEVDRSNGVINGTAEWNQHNAKGQITFQSYYATGDMPAAKGLSADGRIELFNDYGSTVDMHYKGNTLDVVWDHEAQGWWTMSRYEEPSHDWPWYRYHFALLFERPQAAGKYTLTYAGKPVATFRLDEKPPLKIPPASPIKRANQPGRFTPQINPNNPLSYFDILLDARHQARGIVAANNLRQIGLGLRLYLDQNNQQWPESLDALRGTLDGFDQLMTNPRTGAHPGFIYVKPPPGANPAETPVVYESLYGQPDPNGAVLYDDGSIR